MPDTGEGLPEALLPLAEALETLGRDGIIVTLDGETAELIGVPDAMDPESVGKIVMGVLAWALDRLAGPEDRRERMLALSMILRTAHERLVGNPPQPSAPGPMILRPKPWLN